jgi:hypothetical protein
MPYIWIIFWKNEKKKEAQIEPPQTTLSWASLGWHTPINIVKPSRFEKLEHKWQWQSGTPSSYVPPASFFFFFFLFLFFSLFFISYFFVVDITTHQQNQVQKKKIHASLFFLPRVIIIVVVGGYVVAQPPWRRRVLQPLAPFFFSFLLEFKNWPGWEVKIPIDGGIMVVLMQPSLTCAPKEKKGKNFFYKRGALWELEAFFWSFFYNLHKTKCTWAPRVGNSSSICH